MAASLMPMPKQAFYGLVNGVMSPIVGGKVYTYEAGTTTPKATYTTAAGNVANPNPVVLDARGEASVWLGSGAYDIALKGADDALIWTQENVENLMSSGGSSQVGFLQAGTGAVARTAQAKMREIVSADDFGAVGDGVADDTTAIQNALNAAAGKLLMLGQNKTYGITSITIPSGITLLANGSGFRKLAASASYGVIVAGNFLCDHLGLTSPGSASDLGVAIQGSNVRIESLEIASDAENSNVALSIQRTGTYAVGNTVENVYIGRAVSRNYEVGALPYNTVNVTIDSFDLHKYRTGIYLRDAVNFRLNGGTAHTIAAGLVGSAGQNTILVESVLANYSTDGVFISNYISKVAAEHCYRVGGGLVARNIHFTDCEGRKAGSGSAPTGAAGFKVLGPNSVPDYHEAIFLTNCIAEDCNNTVSDNFNGFDFSFIDGLVASNLIVRKRDLAKSAGYGIRLSQLSNSTLSNINVFDTAGGPLRFIEQNTGSGVAMENVSINGGMLHRADNDVIAMNIFGWTYRNVSLSGMNCAGGRAMTRIESPTGGGAYESVSIEGSYLRQDTAGNSIGGPGGSGVLHTVRGVWSGSPTAKDGSTYQDMTNGLFKIRKAGGWYTL